MPSIDSVFVAVSQVYRSGRDDAGWERSVFSANRERLLSEALRSEAEWQNLVSYEYSSVDGSLIDAWTSQKSLIGAASDKHEKRTCQH
ncbi:hypothetical protein [Methylomonas rosea]|uniref:Uncharacterized protein n=1 Tax=Methylomonas rosea TaxID=2952227 RepID=A0ABT1TPM2_9GAMM|nr:hypothetical protein [Methylomonas sp. WSC-7]MCQ8116725.1 hypothetical protein [Methylomonas sp. WSC-7]